MSETLAGGRYTIVRRLATGGMGEVLLAEYRGDPDLTPGLLVVKRILAGAAGEGHAESQIRMLREEGRLGLRLMHGNLVETFLIEESDPRNPLLVIELLAGRSMAQVLGQAKKRKENVPIDVALNVLRGSCCGLHFAHTLKDSDGKSLGLVHRDVSPANIFVTFDGRVKVIDFGVAKSEDSEIKTATGILKGKLGYMSPEQSLGSSKLTAQADVWSLGVFFWEMLVAERLFSSPNPTATLLQISQKEIQRPSVLRPDIPPAVEAICMRMLERDLSRRFQACADVARAIDALPGGGGVSRVDVGAFLAGRFPEEADAGAKDARRCSRKTRMLPIPTGLVDGGSWSDSNSDEPATTVLTAEARAAILAAAAADDGGHPPLRDDDDDGLATVRVTPQVVEAARREAMLQTQQNQQKQQQQRPPKPQPVVVDDLEDLIMTAAVPEGSLASMRASPSSTPLPRPPGPGEVSQTRPNPIATTEPHRNPLPEEPADTQRNKPSLQSITVPILPERVPERGPERVPDREPSKPWQAPPMPGAPAAARPSRTGLQVAPAGAPIVVAPPAPVAPTPPAPVAQLSRPPSVALTPPEATAPPSWLAVALSTFGALVLVMGVGFSFAIARPQPRFLVYADAKGTDVVVGDAAAIPATAVARPLDLQAPSLRRAGAVTAEPVDPAELSRQLKTSGVWARASLPSTTRTTLAALLPVLITALGLLALAFALPVFLVRGTRQLVLRLVFLASVVLATVAGVERGVLSWPGRAAWNNQPTLEWK